MKVAQGREIFFKVKEEWLEDKQRYGRKDFFPEKKVWKDFIFLF
jgi:hypothetical protein